MTRPRFTPGIQPCKSVEGDVYVNSVGKRIPLKAERRLTPKEAGADRRLNMSTDLVRRLISRGELYPVLKRNSRVLLIFECALDDYWMRQVSRNSGNSRWMKTA